MVISGPSWRLTLCLQLTHSGHQHRSFGGIIESVDSTGSAFTRVDYQAKQGGYDGSERGNSDEALSFAYCVSRVRSEDQHEVDNHTPHARRCGQLVERCSRLQVSTVLWALGSFGAPPVGGLSKSSLSASLISSSVILCSDERYNLCAGHVTALPKGETCIRHNPLFRFHKQWRDCGRFFSGTAAHLRRGKITRSLIRS